MKEVPKLQASPKYFDMDREELMINQMQIAKAAASSSIRETEYKNYNFNVKENLAEYLQG